MKKLVIITTHPIQYYAPVFQLLAERKKIHITVLYTWGAAAVNKFDPGFRRAVTWDVPLLDGYPWQWTKNISPQPGSDHFKGIINPDLISCIASLSPDALLLFGWAYDSHLMVMRKFKNKVPIYFRGDSTLLDPVRKHKSFFKSVLLKWVYRHVDCAFYVGKNNKAYFKKYGLSEQQLIFAPHAIDNDRFREKSALASKFRSEMQLTEQSVLVVFAGKFEEKKDPLLLLQAVKELGLPNLHLWCVGNGELENQLRKEAANLPNIHFADFKNQTEMPGVYQSCDLFCLPSRGPGETWGIAVNEAMASGKAILVSDKVGCAADLVRSGENGAVFRAGSLADLKAWLGILASDKSRLAAYGEKSRAMISEWSFLKIVEAIEQKVASDTQEIPTESHA